MNQRRVDMIERIIRTHLDEIEKITQAHIKESRKREEESKQIVEGIKRDSETIIKTLRFMWRFAYITMAITVAILWVSFFFAVRNL